MAAPVVVLATATRNAPIGRSAKWFVGDDITFEHSVVDAAGAARDITGWALQWTLREYPDDPDIVLQVSASVTNGTGGKAQVTIADTDTDSLPARWYSYALRRTDAGAEETVAWGRALLQKGPGA